MIKVVEYQVGLFHGKYPVKISFRDNEDSLPPDTQMKDIALHCQNTLARAFNANYPMDINPNDIWQQKYSGAPQNSALLISIEDFKAGRLDKFEIIDFDGPDAPKSTTRETKFRP